MEDKAGSEKREDYGVVRVSDESLGTLEDRSREGTPAGDQVTTPWRTEARD